MDCKFAKNVVSDFYEGKGWWAVGHKGHGLE